MCKPVCKLCDRLVISQSVTFSGGTLIINLPAGSYNNKCKYCIVLAQSIPSAATIGAPVIITIGSGTEQYPLTKCNCSPATVCGLRSRTKYCVVLNTTATGGAFRLLGRTCCAPDNNLRSVNGAAPTTEVAG